MLTKSFYSLVILLALLCGFAPAKAMANPPATILSLSFNCPDAAIHIGSTITARMVALEVSTQFNNVSVVSAAVGGLVLGSVDLAGASILSTVYVTDGTRTWQLPYTGSNQLALNNGNLLSPGEATEWNLTTYKSIENQTFRVYAGTLINGLLPFGSPTLSAKLGDFGNVIFGDNGPPDTVINSGVWTAQYVVPDLNMIVTASRLYGRCYYFDQVAVNDYFQSPATFSLDGLRPSIDDINFSVPSKPNYNKVLYLSADCQGSSIQNASNTQGRFDIKVNKVNTVVDIVIGTSPPKSLPAIVIPNGSQTSNGWTIWNGDNSAGIFTADGIYTANLYIHDGNGVVGLTHTTQVRVTSMRFELNNIRLSPSGRTAEPTFQDGLITFLNADIVAYRDDNNGATPRSMRSSLIALGWSDIVPNSAGTASYQTPGGLLNRFNDIYRDGAVYALQEVQFLDQSGTKLFGIDPSTEHDGTGGDYDAFYAGRYSLDPVGFFGATPSGDTVKENDWDTVVLEELTVTAGTKSDPYRMKALYQVNLIGSSPPQGNYRLRMRAKLTNLASNLTLTGWHFYPGTNPEGGSFPMGEGIYVEDSSIIFQVTQTQNPNTDNTPPVFLVSNPANGSTVSPKVFGPGNRLTAQLQDSESAMNASGSVSFVTVTDPQGGSVAGTSSTDGGGANNTLTLSFNPALPLDKGGNYKMTINTCNNAGLCVSKEVPFTVLDQTVPSISAVELVPNVGTTKIPLSIAQSGPEGPFQDIAKIEVTLSIPQTSTNVIDANLSNVSLYQIVGITKVPIPLSKTPSVLSPDGKSGTLKYTINNVINYAGKFEVDTQTFSLDTSGQGFTGPPAGTINPVFTTVACLTCISIQYASPGNDAARPAILGNQPLTLTTGVTILDPLTVGVDSPGTSLLPPDPGWIRLASALNASSMRFYISGVLQVSPLTWTFPTTSPVTFRMYYNDNDLPATVTEDTLVVRAYSNGSWATQGQVVQDSIPTTSNAFSWSPTSSQAAGLYYAIAYPSSNPSQGAPTAVPFKSTRSFNPTHANSIFRKARFFYSDHVVKGVEARVFDTAGQLLRVLAVGKGINLTDAQTDAAYGNSQYYFEWDGANDNGTLARNGLYLVRWQVTELDGSTTSVTKPVALIK